jgi:hypothetical protein
MGRCACIEHPRCMVNGIHMIAPNPDGNYMSLKKEWIIYSIDKKLGLHVFVILEPLENMNTFLLIITYWYPNWPFSRESEHTYLVPLRIKSIHLAGKGFEDDNFDFLSPPKPVLLTYRCS